MSDIITHLANYEHIDYGWDKSNADFVWRYVSDIHGKWQSIGLSTAGFKLGMALMNALNRIEVGSNSSQSVAARKTKRLAECKEAMEKVVGFIEVTMAEVSEY